jgi:hypothetical protein
MLAVFPGPPLSDSNDDLDQWLATSAEPALRPKAMSIMKVYCVSTSVQVLALSSTFRAFMLRCSTVGYRPEQSSTNAVIQSTFRQAVRWKMPTEDQDA